MVSRIHSHHVIDLVGVILVLACGHLVWGPAMAQTHDWLISEGPEGGEITTLAQAPNGDIYVGLWSRGGIYRSTDQGLTWQETGLPLDQVSKIVINNAGTVFAAISNGNVLRSFDNGASWLTSATGIVDHNGSIAYDPDLDILFAVTSEYFFRSLDGGNSWQMISVDFPLTRIRCLAAVPGGGPLFVGTNTDKVFRSNNGGVNWLQLADGMTADGIRDLLVAPLGFIYAASYGEGIFRAAWSGASWTQLNNGLDDEFCLAIGQDPAGNLWAGTQASGTYTSENGGLDWAAARTGIERREIRDFLFLGGEDFLAASFGGGVFRTGNSGVAWTPSNGGMNRTQIMAMLLTGNEDMFAATHGAGVHHSTDGGATWAPVNDGIIDPIVYDIVSHPDGDLFCGTWETHIYHSTNGGDSWQRTTATPGIVRVGAMAVRPDNGELFAGGLFDGGIWRSPDKGQSWFDASGDLPVLEVEDIVVEDDGDLLAAFEGGGIFRSENNGDTWTHLNNGLTSLYVSQVLSLPGGVLFAAIPFHGLFRSLDDGALWERVDASLYDSRISCINVNESGFLFAGSLAGGLAFQSNDGGDFWFPISGSFSHVPIHTLAFNANGNLLIGSSGYGIYYTDETTPVQLRYFTAERLAAGSVTVSWSLPANGPLLAVDVFRSVPGAEREQLSAEVPTGGPDFEFFDAAAPAEPCEYWLRLTDAAGVQSWYGPVSVDKADLVVSGLAIESVWPNPAPGSTTIRFSVPRDEAARLDVFDVRGRLVRRLNQGGGSSGNLEAVWDTRDDHGGRVAAGTYFLRLSTDSMVVTGKVVVLGKGR